MKAGWPADDPGGVRFNNEPRKVIEIERWQASLPETSEVNWRKISRVANLDGLMIAASYAQFNGLRKREGTRTMPAPVG
jgi:hypothetical protein